MEFAVDNTKTVTIKNLALLTKDDLQLLFEIQMLLVLFPLMVRKTMRPSSPSAINLNVKVLAGRTYLEPPILNLPGQSFA